MLIKPPSKLQIFNSSCLILLLSLGITGCAKDKTIDQYNQEKEAQAKAAADAVSGNYVGTLTNADSGASIGPIQISLHSQEVTTPANGNTSSIRQAKLAGSITIFGTNPSSVAIQDLSFFPTDNSISGSFPVTVSGSGANKVTSNMYLSGTITGDGFVGTISQTSNFGITGKFETKKDGTMPRSPGQGQAGSGSDSKEYVGTGDYNCSLPQKRTGTCSTFIKMKIVLVVPTELGFYNAFSNEKLISIDLTLAPNDSRGQAVGGGNRMSFASATENFQSGHIDASIPGGSGTSSLVELHCDQTALNAEQPKASWQCSFTTVKQSLHFIANPAN